MQIVIDANPLISVLITPGKVVELLFVEELELLCPGLLFKEIERNKDVIAGKSDLSAEEIEKFLSILKTRIRVVPEEDFLYQRRAAKEICPDEKDIEYFALALHLKCPIWSNEKALKEQKHIMVYATHEMMRIFGIECGGR